MDKNYKGYTLADFLANESFKRWVIHPEDPLLTQKWLGVQKQHPHLIPLMDAARGTILSLRSDLHVPVEKPMGDWASVEKRIAQKSQPSKWHFSFWWAAAACLILLSSLYLIELHTPIVTEATAYGEEKEILLPDGSTVILYPNSTLRYAKSWNRGKSRDVWIVGETHLSVVKITTPNSQKHENVPFKVYLNDSLSVTVLGTEFSVYNRENQAPAVHLESGLVQVNMPDQTVRLLPGEAVTYVRDKGLVKQSELLSISRIATMNELALENALVDEAISYIESNFGVSVHVAKPFLHRRLDGVIPFASAEEALQVLADILDGRLEQRQGSFQIVER